MQILISKIIPNPRQPRKRFNQKSLDELARSMNNPKVGLIQPIVVEIGAGENEGKYVIVDGERRFRAAKLIGWNAIDAVIRQGTNHNGAERLVHAFVANVQRDDMTAMEQARGYKAMLDELGSQEEVAAQTGKSKSTISGYMALLEFEPQIQELFDRGAIVVSPNSVAALRRLDPSRRVQIATSAAVRGASEAVFVMFCNRYGSTLRRKRVPKAESVTPVKAGEHFCCLNLVGSKMLEEPVAKAADLTCKACELYDMASPATCRQCPLVQFLRRL
jgi:ParB family chromosome partitioning protein